MYSPISDTDLEPDSARRGHGHSKKEKKSKKSTDYHYKKKHKHKSHHSSPHHRHRHERSETPKHVRRSERSYRRVGKTLRELERENSSSEESKNHHQSHHDETRREPSPKDKTRSTKAALLDKLIRLSKAKKLIDKQEQEVAKTVPAEKRHKSSPKEDSEAAPELDSFTPPLDLLKKLLGSSQPEASKDPEKIQEEPKLSTSSKKKSVLDLPMPPTCFPVACAMPKRESPISPYTPELDIEQFMHQGSHFKEICPQISACPVVISPTDHSESIAHLALSPKKNRPTIINSRKINQEFPDRSIDTFEILLQIGEGTYGKVFKAMDLKSKNFVALKYVRMEKESEGFPITGLREIKILRSLSHPNVVQLREIVLCSNSKKQKGTFLVFEYMNHDLCGLLENESMKFDEESIYKIFRQILQGLSYCHQEKILHRDLKCSNILVNSKGEVKLADFGLGREWFAERPYTNKVITLWYRPIELLLGEEKYGPPIDIWSLGCILGELFRRQPIFMAKCESLAIDAIFTLCGTPTKNSWPEVVLLPGYRLIKPTPCRRALFETFRESIPALALDLLDKMLCLNPKKRITAEEALKSGWIIHMDSKNLTKPLKLPLERDCHEMDAKSRR